MGDGRCHNEGRRSLGVIRVLKMLQFLQAGGTLNVMDYSETHSIHPRVVRRDLQAIEKAGYAIYEPDKTYYKLLRRRDLQ